MSNEQCGDIRRYLERVPRRMASGGDIEEAALGEPSGENVENGLSPGDYCSVRELVLNNDENLGVLEKQVRGMGADFFDYVMGNSIDKSWRYISDVILYKGSEQLAGLLECLSRYGQTRKNGMFGFVVESDHVHVIHDCSYGGSHCRDSWRSKVVSYGTLQSGRRYNKIIIDFKPVDWYDVFIYFFVQKPGRKEMYIRGKGVRLPSDSERLQWYAKCPVRKRRASLLCSEDVLSGDDFNRDGDADSDYSGPTSSKKGRSEVYFRRPDKSSQIENKVKQLLRELYPSPVSALRDTEEFRSYTMLKNPRNDVYVQAAFEDFGRDINNASLGSLYQMLSDGKPKLFNRGVFYGTLEQSVEVIDQLLRFQYDDDTDAIRQFLQGLVNIINRSIPKCNALSVMSPPSAGKNFFFDMIFAICLNYGQLGSANRHNVFAFQEAPNKRILVWNEPNYEAAVTDTLKMMFAGDPFTVRVKHKSDVHVARTPVIILTNDAVPFLGDIAFRDRILKHKWKAAPFLKDVDFKPYPMAFFEILKNYEIKFE